jgi:hypothetical protein
MNEAVKRHICEICSRPVMMSADLNPAVPHHWECWQKLTLAQQESYVKKAEIIRKHRGDDTYDKC